MAAPAKSNAKKGSKARSQKNALNAFGIAQDMYPTRQKKTPRARELDAEIERKHGRDDVDDEAEDDVDEEPQRKRAKGPSRSAAGDDDAEYGSDSEGNEWRLGGLREDDEDSEIESDDAFGDSDNERFQEYSFKGSKSKPGDDDSDDDSNDDEGETLGADAIDLATALDQYEEESDDDRQADDESGSGGSEGEDGDDSDVEEDEDGSDDDDDDEDEDELAEEVDHDKLDALEGLINDYGGAKSDKSEKQGTSQKLSFGDLGLSSLNDPLMKKSIKLMNKEAKEKRPGAAQKLAVPLSRREQGRLDRSAAYDKTNETLERWTDSVKQNRRAEHLVFPLPQNSDTAGVDKTEIQPLTAKSSNNELESTIMSIMEQSGLSTAPESKPKPREYDEEGNTLSRKEAQNKRRMERELNSREAKRARRIKRIKSKAYHRVHRKQRERDEIAAKEAMEEAGEIDSEEEREAQDRRRALERVGQRHKDSKWAKLGSKNRRAVWDDDFRAGLTEMARKDEELRRRKEGKTGAASDSDATSSSGDDSDEGDGNLRRQLKELEEENDEPQSKLMSMKFMQKAEAVRKQANDDLIRQIKRDLDSEGGSSEDEDEDERKEVGRRSYGTVADNASKPALDTSSRASKRSSRIHDNDEDVDIIINSAPASAQSANRTPAEMSATTAGAWSRGEVRRKSKGTKGRAEELDLNDNVMVAERPQPRKAKPTQLSSSSRGQNGHEDDESGSDSEQHMPLAIRDQAMVARAFAGDDVVAEFAREKDDVVEADDDKVIDNTLPGWGSWVGDGVSARELKRHKGRFLTKVEGIKKKDRKDAKLDKVIINEKRIKKVCLPVAPDDDILTWPERSISRFTASPPLRVTAAIRAVSPTSCRTGMDDQADVPGEHQAQSAHEAGRHCAHVQADGVGCAVAFG